MLLFVHRDNKRTIGDGEPHTPSIAFRHPPPNSARFSYATEGALYLRAAVQRRGQRPPKGSGTDKTVEAASAQTPTQTRDVSTPDKR